MNEIIKVYLETRRLGFKPAAAWQHAMNIGVWNEQTRQFNAFIADARRALGQ